MIIIKAILVFLFVLACLLIISEGINQQLVKELKETKQELEKIKKENSVMKNLVSILYINLQNIKGKTYLDKCLLAILMCQIQNTFNIERSSDNGIHK